MCYMFTNLQLEPNKIMTIFLLIIIYNIYKSLDLEVKNYCLIIFLSTITKFIISTKLCIYLTRVKYVQIRKKY